MGRLSLLGAGPQTVAAAGTNWKTNLWAHYPLTGGLLADCADANGDTDHDADVEVGGVIDATGGAPDGNDCSEFSATPDSFEVSNVCLDFGGLTKLSVAGWFYHNSGHPFDQVLMGQFDTSQSNSLLWFIKCHADEIRFVVNDGTTTWPGYQDDYVVTDAANIADTTWYHLFITYDGSESVGTDKVKIYVDGSLEARTENGTVPSSFQAGHANGDFEIGTHRNAASWHLGGRMYQWSVWTDRIFTSSEVTEHYNSGTPLTYDDY